MRMSKCPLASTAFLTVSRHDSKLFLNVWTSTPVSLCLSLARPTLLAKPTLTLPPLAAPDNGSMLSLPRPCIGTSTLCTSKLWFRDGFACPFLKQSISVFFAMA